MKPKTRYIAHIDMDAFFASVEQLDHPEYRNKPVIVGSDPKGGTGRGVVSTCSYEARKFGIHSAMPISRAYKCCPEGIFVPVNMKRYCEMSNSFFEIFESFTPDIQPISIDEAFLDITGSHHLFGTPVETCKMIKKDIKVKTGLTASVGLAPNMMTAKIASDLEKPDGFVVVAEDGLIDFLHPLPVERIWGAGKKTVQYFHKIGIRTIGDLASLGEGQLNKIFGKHGRHMWELANGIDPRKVTTGEETKSVSNEYTFETDSGDIKQIHDVLMYLSEKVSRRLRKASFKGRTITLKIRFEDFKTYTRSITINQYTNFVPVIYKHIIGKLEEFTPGLKNKKIRLIGVKVSNLAEKGLTPDLFESISDNSSKKTENIHIAMDKIRDKFGEKALRRRF